MNLHKLNQAFRSGELPITNYISQLQSLFDSREPEILSFIPESNRFERLLKEAEELVKKYPEVHNRPPLFG
ncbi:MAG: amidase, partial [Anaerolineales bacterium]